MTEPKMSSTLCDGTIVEFIPRYEEASCDHCGHVTGSYVANEPAFHGKSIKRDGKYFCTRCGEELSSLTQITELVENKILPSIIEEMLKPSPFLWYLKKRA